MFICTTSSSSASPRTTMAPTPAVICYQHSEYQEVDLSTPWLVELAEREQREM